MNRLVIIMISVLLLSTTYARTTPIEILNKPIDYTVIDNNPSLSQHVVAYRLFPTENMWTFIKLDTRNGKIWMVQYDVNGNNRFETYLNLSSLVSKDREVNGRFTLYPTQNIYTFILLDQLDGRTWQIQWAIEPENRFIIPIK